MSERRLLDMEPGGESTQYESIRTFTQSPPKQSGQLGGDTTHTGSEFSTGVGADNGSKDNRDDEDIAQGLDVGRLTDESGAGDKDTRLGAQSDAAAAKTRRQQGYGPGSGVGA